MRHRDHVCERKVGAILLLVVYHREIKKARGKVVFLILFHGLKGVGRQMNMFFKGV